MTVITNIGNLGAIWFAIVLIAIKKYQLNIKLFDKLNKKKIIDFCYRNHKLFN